MAVSRPDGAPALPSEAAPERDAADVAGGAGGLLAARAAAGLLRLLAHVAIARWLGPAALGAFAVGWMLVHLLAPVADLGLSQGVIHLGARARREEPAALRGLVVRAVALALAGGSALGALAWGAAPWLARDVFAEPAVEPVLRALAPGLALLAGLRVAASATRLTRRMKVSAWSQDAGQAAAQLLLVVAACAWGAGAAGAAAAVTASFGLGFALALAALPGVLSERAPAGRGAASGLRGDAAGSSAADPAPPGPGGAQRQPAPPRSSAGTTRALLAFSLPTVPASSLTRLGTRLDVLLLASLLTAVDAGTYQAAAQLPLLMALVLGAFGTSVAPVAADLHHEGGRARLDALFKSTTRWAVSVSLPAFVVLVTLPGVTLGAIFGPDFARGAGVLAVLAIAQLVNVASGSVGAILIQSGRQRQWSLAASAGVAVNVTLALLWIPWLGAVGAALATLLANVLRFSLGLGVARRQLAIAPWHWPLWKPLAAGGLAAAAVMLASRGLDGLPLLCAGVPLAVSVHFAALLLFGVEPSDRAALAEWLARRRARLGAS